MINKIMQKYVLSQNTRWEENTNTKLPFTYNEICIKILYMYIKYKYKKQCSPRLFSRYKIKMTPCFHYFLFIFVLCPKIIYMLLILINSRKKTRNSAIITLIRKLLQKSLLFSRKCPNIIIKVMENFRNITVDISAKYLTFVL